MAHELSIVNGAAEMFSGSNTLPWHKLGTVVAGLLTAAEALEAAHLNWKVKGYPVSVNGRTLEFPDPKAGLRFGQQAGDRDKGASTENTWQGICREDSGDCLGIMRGRYTPIQNSEAFGFFDRLVGDGKAVYDTAGALRGGRQVWLLAKIDGTVKIGNDDHNQYGLLVTSHDGSYSLMCCFVMVRVVCANTLSLALSGAKNLVKIRHTVSWQDKEAEARRVLGIGEKYFATVQEALSGLGSHLLTPDQMADFSRILLPAEDETNVPTRTANIRAELNRLFERGAGNHGRTRFDAFQAVTDYADHSQVLRGAQSTRIESAILGSGARLKQTAYEYLTSADIMDELMNRPHAIRTNSAQAAGELARLLSKN